MAAALIAGVLLGIFVGATYARNVRARTDVKDAQRAFEGAKKGRWAALRRLSLVVACLVVVLLGVVISEPQTGGTSSGAVSYPAYVISMLLVALGGWLVLRYVATTQAWKTAADRRKAVAKARQIRAGTILPLLLSLTIFIAALYAFVTAVG